MHVFFLFDLKNFEFSKLPVTNPEHDFLPGFFLFVQMQIKIVSRMILVIIFAPVVQHSINTTTNCAWSNDCILNPS